VSSLHATCAAAQPAGDLQNPQVEIAYVPPSNPAFRPIQERLQQYQVLEQTRRLLTPLKLPRKLSVRFEQCGAARRPFKAQGPATICYEMIEQIERIAAKVDPSMTQMVLIGTVVQTVFHEVAGAVFDILQVPLWGRSEDAADNLTAFLMLQFGDDLAGLMISGTAVFFATSDRTWTGSQFADVTSPEGQRYFNFACMAYGSDPKTFAFLAKAEPDKKPLLPESRAPRCAGEYQKFRRAFELRIMPYVDPDLLVRVRATPWLR
jgi:hypothetical protein